eukprot:contig_16015_g3845
MSRLTSCSRIRRRRRKATAACGDALDGLTAPGAFATGGLLHGLPDPGLAVAGVGPVALPLSDAAAAALDAVCEAAPYGHGQETVVDETVRRARQAPAAHVTTAPGWDAALQKAASQVVATRLGLPDVPVAAVLDKLVLYEAGGHFQAHQDTEKGPGMFATLVVQLPTAARHSGWVFEVSHRGFSTRLDGASVYGTAGGGGGGGARGGGGGGTPYFFAAFSADC